MAFVHKHPYEPYLFPGVTKLIVGTLSPPRFSTGELRPGDVDFCYGSRDGLLWPVLDRIFGLQLAYETSRQAIDQRKAFLQSRGIGICDIVARAHRDKIDASDLGMNHLELRDLPAVIKAHAQVHTLLFTGGNSKNGPEYLFRRQLKAQGLTLKTVDSEVPRIHEVSIPLDGKGERTIRTVSLTAPSGSANRAIGSMRRYKERKAADPTFTVMDFRMEQYQPCF